MKMVFTHENGIIVGNAKNILKMHGLDVIVQNEFASGAAGELAMFDTWAQLWVVNDKDYDRACGILNDALNSTRREDWICNCCLEKNDTSFDFCWKCSSCAE